MQRNLSFKFWLRALGIVILAAGLAAAYLVKTRAVENASVQYRIVGGEAYLAQSDDSKQDADQLQRFGGTPAIIIAAYKQKLHHLLQGENLAYLLAIVAIILAIACFRLASEMHETD